MRYTKKCDGCIWADKCAQGVACDDYYPISTEEQEVYQIEMYEKDLADRAEEYEALIEEQNS